MSDLQFEQVANIKVFGIGGGGCNAVNRMVSEGVKGVYHHRTWRRNRNRCCTDVCENCKGRRGIDGRYRYKAVHL